MKQKLREAKDLITSSEFSTDEKANKLYQLLLVQAENTKKLEIEAGSIRKRTSNSQREKEALINEINSNREVKSKIEKFCRELKQKNDEITTQCKEIEKSEKEKLEELTEKNKLMEENKALLKQMEDLREQALSRDQEFQNIIMEKNLEVQLLKVQVEYKNGYEESQIKSQVDLYKTKYGEFQSILDKSTDAYSLADSELKKINDKISLEQKENNELRKIKEKFDIELIQLFTSKKTLSEELGKLRSQHDSIKLECSKLLAAKKK